jgi:hypothetical protein
VRDEKKEAAQDKNEQKKNEFSISREFLESSLVV